jgi:hypothetical protein
MAKRALTIAIGAARSRILKRTGWHKSGDDASVIAHINSSEPHTFDLPPLDGAKGKLGIADLKEGDHAAKEAFG